MRNRTNLQNTAVLFLNKGEFPKCGRYFKIIPKRGRPDPPPITLSLPLLRCEQNVPSKLYVACVHFVPDTQSIPSQFYVPYNQSVPYFLRVGAGWGGVLVDARFWARVEG
jgi:hypothetical protein